MLGRHLEVFLTKQFWASCCLTRTSMWHSVVPCGILRVLWYRGIMVYCGILRVFGIQGPSPILTFHQRRLCGLT